MSDARIGFGATFEVFYGSAFFTLGEVTNITLPQLKRDTIDATGIGDEYRVFVKGMKDSGEITVEMNFAPGSITDAVIRELFDDGEASAQFRITIPSGGSPSSEQLTGNAILTGYNVTAPLDNKMAATLTFKITGRVQYTSG